MMSQLAELLSISPEDQAVSDIPTLREHIGLAKQALRQVKRKATLLRETFLQESANLSASLHRWDATAARKSILARERASRQFRELRRILHGGRSSGFDRLDIPDEYAVRQEGAAIPRIPLVLKEEIEEVLLPHTEQRFRQHQETPFGTATLSMLNASSLGLMIATLISSLRKLENGLGSSRQRSLSRRGT
jgi:hypothetical protein